MTIKNKIIILLAFTVCCSLYSQVYNFKNDYKYRNVLREYNCIGKNWCVAENYKLPAELLRYRTTDTSIIDSDKTIDGIKSLVPLEAIVFEKDGTFDFFWFKSSYEAGNINGLWKIDNSELILTLLENYGKPYLKDKQLRYKITGTDNNGSSLLLKGTSYPDSIGIVSTSDDIITDFEKIVAVIDQDNVTTKFPEIIRAKEAELRTRLQLTEK